MAIPEPVLSTTMSYLGITIGLLALTFMGHCFGMVKKETAQIAYVLYILGFVCTWLFWLCVWLHQWHPLIMPEWKDE